MVRYYGYYSNKSRGLRKKNALDGPVPNLIDTDIVSKEFKQELEPFDSESLQLKTF